MGSGLKSRSGLAHESALAIGVDWKGSDRCSGVASGLWIELSLGFGAQKRARCRGWLEGFGSMLGCRQWALD